MSKRLLGFSIAALLGAVTLAGLWLATGHSLPGQAPHWTEAESLAARAAESALRRQGYWQDGSKLSISPHQEGWFVLARFPGNYVGGHCGVVLKKNYQLVRIIGGR